MNSTSVTAHETRLTLEEYLSRFFPMSSKSRYPRPEDPRKLGMALADQAVLELRKQLHGRNDVRRTVEKLPETTVSTD